MLHIYVADFAARILNFIYLIFAYVWYFLLNSEKMAYDLNGKKYILSVNIVKYTGINRDRIGTENDEEAIIKTFEVSLYAQY